MFEPRNILYFNPFYFKNGNTPKTKYLVVLTTVCNNAILASLPTSKDHIPDYYKVQDGCIEIPDANFNCFSIAPMTCVTECGKSFPRRTFLYGQHIDTYNLDEMKNLYPIEGVNYAIWGKMKQCLFEDLIFCFRNSKSVKQKYKKLLQP